MLFNSFIFWAFFLAVIAIYWRLNHRAQNVFLLAASYTFYGYWDWRFLSLIALSTLVDFVVARRVADTGQSRKRRAWLSLSICTNLGLLGFFKYFDFFVHEFAQILEMLGVGVSMPSLKIILPVGISFYTFQTLSYTIDVYRGTTRPTNNLLDFAVYVAFFPQLVAGPIERSKDLMPQILSHRKLDKNAFSEGLYHVLFGMFKKVVVADNLAPIVERVFSTPTAQLTSLEILFGVYAFAIQIYCDFSGYSSIAQGLAKWLGINLSWNFKMPYFSSTPSEFWQRWHITLSSWLRDYLYVPLGGNRLGAFNTFRNLVITMGLGGLWHGANWTFIIWGLIHGGILVFYRVLEDWGVRLRDFSGWKRVLSVLIFFHLVCITWIYFRAESLTQANQLVVGLFASPQLTNFSQYIIGMLLFYSLPMLLLELKVESSSNLLYVMRLGWLKRAIIYCYFVLMLIVFPPLTPQVFVYFQF